MKAVNWWSTAAHQTPNRRLFSLQPGSRESHGPWVGGERKGFLKREPPRKALVSEFASFIHERSTTKHSDWLEIPWKVNFLMLIMVEITLFSYIFRLFFFPEGQCPLTFLGERGIKASFSGTVIYNTTIQLLYLLRCLWKTLFAPLTYTSLEV